MTEPTIETLEGGLRIDANDLEGERRTQHDKFYVVSKQLALATSRRDQAKQNKSELEAKLAELIRAEWQGPERLTDGKCHDMVARHQDMIDAERKYLDCAREYALWYALRDAFAQRHDALSDLIKMHLSQHYGESRLDRAEYEAVEARAARQARAAAEPPPSMPRRRI